MDYQEQNITGYSRSERRHAQRGRNKSPKRKSQSVKIYKKNETQKWKTMMKELKYKRAGFFEPK